MAPSDEHIDPPPERRTLKPPDLARLPTDVQTLLQRVMEHRSLAVTDFLDPLQYRASVLIPLLWNPHTGQIQVQLTQRSSKMRSHAGEVAFPGGKKDETDADDVETALREAMEEIGLPESSVTILGLMDATVSRGLLVVTPVVGLIPHEFEPEFNEDEVQAVFRADLASFLDPGDYTGNSMIWNSAPWTFHQFTRQGHTITGMTALLLVRLAELVYGTRFPKGVGSTRDDCVQMIRHLVKEGRFKWREGVEVVRLPDYLRL